MDLDPRRLLLLEAISGTDSLAQAARRLGHTPSAVSQQLAKLEREAGVPLVERGGGRLELTEAGRILARAGHRIGDSLADAERELLALTGTVTGPLTVAAPAGGHVLVAAGAVRLLATRHPELLPTVVEVEDAEGLRMLHSGGADVVLVSDDRDTAVPVPSGYVARLVMEDDYRVAVPAAWDIPATFAELSGRPWITAPPGSARARCFRRLADLHGIVPSREHLSFTPSTTEAMAAAGLGAVLAPRFHADWLKNCVVLDLPVPGSFIGRAIHRATPAADAFVRAIAECALRRGEELVESGIHKREIYLKRLADPSTEQPQERGR
jgi:DNA-binding transcriptional LysR family regulator